MPAYPAEITVDLPRLEAELTRQTNGDLVLIGRRQLSSNNSWMHNLEPLVRGQNRCTAQLHPDDATRLGLHDGAIALIRSRTGNGRYVPCRNRSRRSSRNTVTPTCSVTVRTV